MTGEPGRTHAQNAGRLPSASRRRPDLGDLAPRAASAVVLVAVAITTAVVGGVGFALLWWLAALGINWEWQRLLGPDRQRWRLVAGSVAITAAVVAAQSDVRVAALMILLAGTGAVALCAGRSHPLLAGLGVAYAGLLPLALITLRASGPYGLDAIVWLFAVVWGTDVMAYFGGRLIGGAKLWPAVSPSKTWSGFLVGVGSGALAGLAVASSWGPGWPLIPLGVAAGVAAQAGDLFESSLKRRFGVKDSSRIIPGHGGLMDRLDGFLTASIFAVCFGLLRGGLESAGAGLLRW